MIDGILDGISLALAEAFPNCAVFGDERVRQGLKTPSFFVGLGECKLRPLPNGLAEQRQHVEVVYFPERQGDYDELWAIGPKTLNLLGELRLSDGGQVRGTSLGCNINEGLMHLHAIYILRLKPIETTAPMGHMTHQTMKG